MRVGLGAGETMQMDWDFVNPGHRFVAGETDPRPQPAWRLEAMQNEYVMAQLVPQTVEPAVATIGSNLAFDWTARCPRLWGEAVTATKDGNLVPALNWVGFVPDDEGLMVGRPRLLGCPG